MSDAVHTIIKEQITRERIKFYILATIQLILIGVIIYLTVINNKLKIITFVSYVLSIAAISICVLRVLNLVNECLKRWRNTLNLFKNLSVDDLNKFNERLLSSYEYRNILIHLSYSDADKLVKIMNKRKHMDETLRSDLTVTMV